MIPRGFFNFVVTHKIEKGRPQNQIFRSFKKFSIKKAGF